MITNDVPTALVRQLRSEALTCPASVPSAPVHLRGKDESVAEDVSHTQLNDRTTRAGSARLAEEEEEERGCARCWKMSLWMILPVSLPVLTFTGIWVV